MQDVGNAQLGFGLMLVGQDIQPRVRGLNI